MGVRFSTVFVSAVVLVASLGVFSLGQSVSDVQPSFYPVTQQAIAPLSLPWPAYGQSAIGAIGYGVLDEHNTDKPAPTASTAKIFTALMVLKAKPLQIGQQGPLITFTAHDEQIYREYAAKGGSVYPVTAGEQISQRQALDGLLVLSANNLADMLATWAYGSVDAYAAAANEYFATQQLAHTTIADASWFSPKTVSTAHDMTLAAALLLQDPVLAAVVSQPEVDVPGIGAVPNTNVLLGSDGVTGVKTGNTDEAGGCFVISLKYTLDDSHEVTLIATVFGAPTVPDAMRASKQLVTDTKTGFRVQPVVYKGEKVAQYNAPWGTQAIATAQQDAFGLVWAPLPPAVKPDLQAVPHGSAAGTVVGTVSARVGADTVTVPVALDSSIGSPSFAWKLYKRYL